ncbi:MAG: pitrilysin family protein [Caldilineaceae bacterium]
MSQQRNAIPGPDNITRVVFDNGITVLVRENHAAPVTVLEGCLPAGSLSDPLNKIGLSSFVASMLTRGSAHYDFDTFNETIESIGASLGVGSDTHWTHFSATSLSEDFPTISEVLADILRRPTFPPEHVERLRGQKLVYLQEREQDTQQVANYRFYETIYPNHPYGRPSSGYLETVSAIQQADLPKFYEQHYTPNGAIIVVVGDVQTGAVLDWLNKQLGDWRAVTTRPQTPPVAPQSQVQQKLYPIPGKVQSDIMIGCLAVARQDPDYYAVRVANTVLGQFGMMGRLGEQVREQQGLAYYCGSSLDAEFASGAWYASAGVNPENVEQAVDSILAEFARLGDELVSAEELADSQAYMTGVLPLTLETNEGVASTLINMERYGLGLDYLQRYNQLIYGITPADVQRVARRYLRPDHYTLVVAGPSTGEA